MSLACHPGRHPGRHRGLGSADGSQGQPIPPGLPGLSIRMGLVGIGGMALVDCPVLSPELNTTSWVSAIGPELTQGLPQFGECPGFLPDFNLCVPIRGLSRIVRDRQPELRQNSIARRREDVEMMGVQN